MVMPRSRSISMLSSTCSFISRAVSAAGLLDQAVGQRRLAVVDVGDDGEVADAGKRRRHGRASSIFASIGEGRRLAAAFGLAKLVSLHS